jgi:hypothetical protein
MPRQKAGFLFKKGHVRKNWKKRYFVLDGVWLSYYVKLGGQRKGAIDLSTDGVLIRGALQIRAADISRFQFEIVHNNSTLVIASEDQKQMNDWIEALNIAVWTAQMGVEGDEGEADLPPGLPGVTDEETQGKTRAASVETALVAARGAPPPIAVALAEPEVKEDLGDWESLTDGDGNEYFYNHISKVSSRQHPSAHAPEPGSFAKSCVLFDAMASAGAPPVQEGAGGSLGDWAEHVDADGNAYYYNSQTHVSSRQHPSIRNLVDSPGEEEAAPMHAEWDPESGEYFFHATADEDVDGEEGKSSGDTTAPPAAEATGGTEEAKAEEAKAAEAKAEEAKAAEAKAAEAKAEAPPKRKTMVKRSSLKVLVDKLAQKDILEGKGSIEEDDEELLLERRHKVHNACTHSNTLNNTN